MVPPCGRFPLSQAMPWMWPIGRLLFSRLKMEPTRFDPRSKEMPTSDKTQHAFLIGKKGSGGSLGESDNCGTHMTRGEYRTCLTSGQPVSDSLRYLQPRDVADLVAAYAALGLRHSRLLRTAGDAWRAGLQFAVANGPTIFCFHRCVLFSVRELTPIASITSLFGSMPGFFHAPGSFILSKVVLL